MKKILAKILEKNRLRTGPYASSAREGLNGAFLLSAPTGVLLHIIASDGTDPIAESWEHVSISARNRVPNWGEMHFVKRLFWEDHEAVIQFHPPESEYVNCPPNCLHLWRHADGHKTPPAILMGPK